MLDPATANKIRLKFMSLTIDFAAIFGG